jgi:CRISPR/Cas system CSM-associated protein Csm3 (group 7 of RAMP superfamily)
MTRLDFKLRFELHSGIHTTGDRVELWTDKALALDWKKEPVVPATTIKGWMRENAERVLRALGIPVCDGSKPSLNCGCLICRLFGHPRRKSNLLFLDCVLGDALRDSRTNVSLSRHRKAAYEERLFTSEVAWTEILEVRGFGFFLNDEEAKTAAAVLWLSAKAGFALGSSRSRGLGWLRLKDFEFKCDEKPIPEENLKGLVKALGGEG